MNLEAINPERLESLHTIGEVKDPPGTSFYTPTYPPTHRVRRVDKGEDTVTEDQYHQDKSGMSFDSKIIWLFAKSNWSIRY